MIKSATIAAGLAFVVLIIPALVLGQTYVGDMGIDPEDVQLGKAEYSPYLDQLTAPLREVNDPH